MSSVPLPGEGGGREQVRACFESLRCQRVPISLETADGVEMEGRVESLDDTRGRLVLSIPRAPSSGCRADDELHVFFTMNGQRWTGRVKVHYHNDIRNRFTVIMPRELEPRDRRRELRVVLDTSENIRGLITPLAFGALQLRGRLSNLSEGGFRIQVESVLETATARELDARDVELEEGQDLEQIHILNLREEPLEAQGRLMEIDRHPLGAILGVRFKPLRGEDRAFLKEFVENRSRNLPSAALPEPRSEGASGREGGDTRKRLKKRLCAVLLVAPPSSDRDQLVDFLVAEGFGTVLIPGDLPELKAMVQRLPGRIVLMDGNLDGVEAETLVEAVHGVAGNRPCPLLAAGDLPETLRSGVDRILARPLSGPDVVAALEACLDGRLQAPSEVVRRGRRPRSLAVAMPPGEERDRVVAFLAQQGFAPVLPAGTLGELAALAREGGADLILVDWPPEGSRELEVIDFLMEHPFPSLPKLVLASSQSSPGAGAHGVARLLPRPYRLDPHLAEFLQELLTEA